MIKADIIKRIKAIEQQILDVETPDAIMIYYDWLSEKWVVEEKVAETHFSKLKYFKHYKEYVFHPRFEGVVILDLIDCPDEFQANLHSIQMSDFKEENNIQNCAISFEAVQNDVDGTLEQSFKVVVYDTLMTQKCLKT